MPADEPGRLSWSSVWLQARPAVRNPFAAPVSAGQAEAAGMAAPEPCGRSRPPPEEVPRRRRKSPEGLDREPPRRSSPSCPPVGRRQRPRSRPRRSSPCRAAVRVAVVGPVPRRAAGRCRRSGCGLFGSSSEPHATSFGRRRFPGNHRLPALPIVPRGHPTLAWSPEGDKGDRIAGGDPAADGLHVSPIQEVGDGFPALASVVVEQAFEVGGAPSSVRRSPGLYLKGMTLYSYRVSARAFWASAEGARAPGRE